MIIRDAREILTAEDLRLNSIAKNKSIEEKKAEKIKEAFSSFRDFRLNQRSKEELEKFFRYLLRNLKQEEKIQYNFLVHSDDDVEAENFVRVIETVMRQLGAGEKSSVILPEMELFANEGAILDKLKDSAVFAVHSCIPLKIYRSDNLRITSDQDAVWRKFLHLCAESPGTCKIICASDAVIAERFRNDEHLYYRIFQHHIYLQEMTIADIAKQVISRIRDRGFTITETFYRGLDEYLNVVYPKADLRNYRFSDDLVNRILSSYYGSVREDNVINETCLPYFHKNLSYQEKLNNLVGLHEVKEKIIELDRYMQFCKQSSENGLKLENMNLHMLFMGNPGTGKTTVARIVADILYNIGIIRKNKVVEVERKDLVAQYIGHTAIKTAKVIEQAMGGVLFIDEAYSLVPEDSLRDFGSEAIETLITAMENQKGKFVVIFAGYQKEMQRFVDSNPGISSRIGYQFLFKDYSTEELLQLYEYKIKDRGFVCQSEDAIAKVKLLFEQYGSRKNAGNGRFVNNVIQNIIIKHANRVTSHVELDRETCHEITAEDIPGQEEMRCLFGNE